MKATLISAALFVSAVALANDEKTAIEKKAETKDLTNRKPLNASESFKKDGYALTQSQLLDKLHKVSVGHTEMGNLAQTHGGSDAVKALGTKMAKDFGGLDQQVIGYAKDRDIVVGDATGMFKDARVKAEKGATLDETRASKMTRLGKLQGAEFDQAFLTATIEGCNRFIPLLEASQGKYEDKKFDSVLNKAIDTLKGYQADAEKLQQEQPITPAS